MVDKAFDGPVPSVVHELVEAAYDEFQKQCPPGNQTGKAFSRFFAGFCRGVEEAMRARDRRID